MHPVGLAFIGKTEVVAGLIHIDKSVGVHLQLLGGGGGAHVDLFGRLEVRPLCLAVVPYYRVGRRHLKLVALERQPSAHGACLGAGKGELGCCTVLVAHHGSRLVKHLAGLGGVLCADGEGEHHHQCD